MEKEKSYLTSSQTQSANPEQTNVLLIYTGDNKGAFALDDVERVLRAVELLILPDMPSHLEGLLNMNGRILPVIDLRHNLSLPRTELEPEHFLVIVKCQKGLIAVRSEAVPEMKPSESDLTSALSDFGACPKLLKKVMKVDGSAVPIYNTDMLYCIGDFSLAASVEAAAGGDDVCRKN
jgi:purine-binding chemotaxis protein CheW